MVVMAISLASRAMRTGLQPPLYFLCSSCEIGALGTACTDSVVISLRSSPGFSSSPGSRLFFHAAIHGGGSLLYALALPKSEMQGPVNHVVSGRWSEIAAQNGPWPRVTLTASNRG